MTGVGARCGAVLILFGALIWATGCANTGGEASDDAMPGGDVRQEIEEEFGVLTKEQIASFEKELAQQYRQLALTYADYDELRQAAPEELEQNHEEHRTHRRLKRRHQRLAQLHEDRMWLHAGDEGPSSEDRHLAQAHRAAARWHEERFEQDGNGIVEQDSELEVLRNSIHDARPEGVDVTVKPAGGR